VILYLAIFSARYNIYISHLCYDVSVRLSVRLSVTEVHWRIIANLGVLLAVLLAGGSSRAMLASARSLEIQYRSVTDTHRQTDRHTTTACNALSIASRGKN